MLLLGQDVLAGTALDPAATTNEALTVFEYVIQSDTRRQRALNQSKGIPDYTRHQSLCLTHIFSPQ